MELVRKSHFTEIEARIIADAILSVIGCKQPDFLYTLTITLPLIFENGTGTASESWIVTYEQFLRVEPFLLANLISYNLKFERVTYN